MGMDTTPVLQIKGKEVNQMDMKLVDSEIKVMDVLWKEGDSMAKHVADVMKERYGWKFRFLKQTVIVDVLFH